MYIIHLHTLTIKLTLLMYQEDKEVITKIEFFTQNSFLTVKCILFVSYLSVSVCILYFLTVTSSYLSFYHLVYLLLIIKFITVYYTTPSMTSCSHVHFETHIKM